MLAGMTVVAANAGGAFSPIGDVTTTMLWIGGQISAGGVIRRLFLPSVISILIPLLAASFLLSRRRDAVQPSVEAMTESAPEHGAGPTAARREGVLVFFLGVALLVAVPVFKILTGLPPWAGILGALGILWLVTDLIHRGKAEEARTVLGPIQAFSRIDLPSLVFFIGILMAVGALEHVGILASVSDWLTLRFPDERIVVFILGMLSAVIDNVPLVAGAMGMFDLATYPMDHRLWEFLAFCAGTGGSLLVIGSAAGVVAMGLEGIGFGWYLRRIAPLALLGYLAGAASLALL
jgi:Na+/H+ antiporter NhaD/arsenite permease-like protein